MIPSLAASFFLFISQVEVPVCSIILRSKFGCGARFGGRAMILSDGWKLSCHQMRSLETNK